MQQNQGDFDNPILENHRERKGNDLVQQILVLNSFVDRSVYSLFYKNCTYYVTQSRNYVHVLIDVHKTLLK